MLVLLTVVKALSEILVLGLIGQGILWLAVRKPRERNIAYRAFAAVTRPVMWLARAIAPPFVPDRYIWIVAVSIVFAVWVVAGQQKLEHCLNESPDSPLCVEVVKTPKER